MCLLALDCADMDYCFLVPLCSSEVRESVVLSITLTWGSAGNSDGISQPYSCVHAGWVKTVCYSMLYT